MKNINLGIISLVAVIGFSMVACDSGGGGNNNGTNYSCQISTGSCIQTVSVSDCLQAGGSVVDFCQGQPSSSSDTPSGGASSSSQNAQISSSGGGTDPSVNTSLDGVWVMDGSSSGITITISGNSGIYSSCNYTDGPFKDAVTKGYVKIGDTYLRNLTSTGTLTWSGQRLQVVVNASSPNVAEGTDWANTTITMSANGQTLSLSGTDGNGAVLITLTRSSYSLNGVWVMDGSNSGITITISGNNGIYSSCNYTDGPFKDAVTKGYVKIGDTYLRNLTSTGTLTWSGQRLQVTVNASSPNVAEGTAWANTTITMSADGQTLSLSGTDGNGAVLITLTRQ